MNQSQDAQLQNSLQAAIKTANDTGVQIERNNQEIQVVSYERRIFEALSGSTEYMLISEVQDALEPFGYSAVTIAARTYDMYSSGLLERTLKKPYAYRWKVGATEPEKRTISIRVKPTRAQRKEREDRIRSNFRAQFNSIQKPTPADHPPAYREAVAAALQSADYMEIKEEVERIKKFLDDTLESNRKIQTMARMIGSPASLQTRELEDSVVAIKKNLDSHLNHVLRVKITALM